MVESHFVLLADHLLVSPHCQGIQEHQSFPGRQKVFMKYYGLFFFSPDQILLILIGNCFTKNTNHHP